MSNLLENAAKYASEKVYQSLSKHSGTMLLTTSIIGIASSAAAQMGMIFFNNKYSKSQKSFMLPQEAMEGLISAMSIFLITKPVQKITLKLLKSGKILPQDLVTYLDKNKLLSNRGKKDFNVKKTIEQTIKKIETSDRFIKTTATEQINLLMEHKKALQAYKDFEDSSMAIATTGAVAMTTAVIIPLGRNKIASRCQKTSLQYHNPTSYNKI